MNDGTALRGVDVPAAEERRKIGSELKWINEA